MVPVCVGAADALVVAGDARFAAHAALLSAHSGYFRASLAEKSSTTPSGHGGDNVVYLPDVIAPHHFWPLLAYMYTGYLQPSADNVYQLLLAAHLLHMPRALHVCRTFLDAAAAVSIAEQPQPLPPPPTIIKPIPQYRRQQQQQQATSLVSPASDIGHAHSNAAFRATSSATKELSTEEQEKDTTIPKTTTTTTTSESGAVVVDIACCDGPVRFHRVLNGAYGRNLDADANTTDSEDSYVEVEEDTRTNAFDRSLNRQMNVNLRNDRENNQPSYTCVYCKHTFKSQYCYQKHARRHLNPVSIDADSRQQQQQQQQQPPLPQQQPVQRISSPTRREVKLLDMNVQYYPCKSCGSKFPSYYFVHKHRKMCHADELNEGGPSGASASATTTTTITTTTTTSSNSRKNATGAKQKSSSGNAAGAGTIESNCD